MNDLPPADRLWRDEPPPTRPAAADPYRPPREGFGLPSAPGRTPSASLERLRLDCLGRESSIRAVGTLGIIGGSLVVTGGLFAIVSLAMTLDLQRQRVVALVPLIAAGISTAFGALALAAGILTRGLHPAGRIITTLLYALGLVGFAIGAVGRLQEHGLDGGIVPGVVQAAISVLFLWFLWSDPASEIFSAFYRREVLPQTRHLKPPISPILIVFLGLLIVVIAAVAWVTLKGTRALFAS